LIPGLEPRIAFAKVSALPVGVIASPETAVANKAAKVTVLKIIVNLVFVKRDLKKNDYPQKRDYGIDNRKLERKSDFGLPME
jgi:hypothetical protein